MFNILVVEDNTDMRELFCTVQKANGYNSIPAVDGLEALDVIDKTYIDLIVADIMMPRMNGYELTLSLRDADYTMPILIVTAKDQFNDMKQGFRAGADDYMIKPINLRELVLRVEALLDQVWFNLLDNAIKHSPENDTITILITTSDNSVSVSIVNNGRGTDEYGNEFYGTIYLSEWTGSFSTPVKVNDGASFISYQR